ncbi:MAG TPA: hypothetical protein VLA04_03980 [Verrucomicrobiae bacterium]|nr:hypothetical protein [Verrucomicrobiae bacterium]
MKNLRCALTALWAVVFLLCAVSARSQVSGSPVADLASKVSFQKAWENAKEDPAFTAAMLSQTFMRKGKDSLGRAVFILEAQTSPEKDYVLELIPCVKTPTAITMVDGDPTYYVVKQMIWGELSDAKKEEAKSLGMDEMKIREISRKYGTPAEVYTRLKCNALHVRYLSKDGTKKYEAVFLIKDA